jgi:membrane protease YdiL (CAAX protease family)
MTIEFQPPASPDHSVPWKFMDNWTGVALLALLNVIIFILTLGDFRTDIAQSAAIIVLELAYLLPVIIIFAWRRIHWRALGFGKFDASTLGIGCGLLLASYMLIIVHNLVLVSFGIDTQAETIIRIFTELDAPVWFILVGAIFAPLVEEIFFRGFLFQGFRARYGWVSAMLLSAAIFAVAHLDPVALIPTFILGCLLAYLYHRSNTVWPGVILHFLVNALGLCAAYVASVNPNLIPA